MGTTLKKQNIFKQFCKIDCNREEILTQILVSEDIPFKVVQIDSARHIFIYPENFRDNKPVNVLIAHYDRVSNTPGANDNSAAVFYLLNHAKRLKDINHSTIIIFTDKEEITGKDSVTNQGSYSLGKYFRSKNLQNLSFFIFDMCGIGTTVILGTAGENLIKEHYKDKYHKSKIKKDINNIKQCAENYLLDQNAAEFFYLTPLFSDDLGLILNEYPSILISLLPYREVINYKKNPTVLPNSWKCNHSMNDNVDTLDAKSWSTLSPLLQRISGIKSSNNNTNSTVSSFMCYKQKLLSWINESSKTKPLRLYILKESFNYSNIKTNNTKRLRTFLLFSSYTQSNVLDFIKDFIPIETDDLTYDIYIFLKQLVHSEFNLLPLKIRYSLYKLSKGKTENDILNFLYTNTLLNIKSSYCISSEPLKERIRLETEVIKIKRGQYKFNIKSEDDIIGEIFIKSLNNVIILEKGIFTPDKILSIDPLNMLKGVRIALIKWAKLNNNNSLQIDLNEFNWIGCYQFFNLIKLELEGRTRIDNNSNLSYIWKRYHGK